MPGKVCVVGAMTIACACDKKWSMCSQTRPLPLTAMPMRSSRVKLRARMSLALVVMASTVKASVGRYASRVNPNNVRSWPILETSTR